MLNDFEEHTPVEISENIDQLSAPLGEMEFTPPSLIPSVDAHHLFTDIINKLGLWGGMNTSLKDRIEQMTISDWETLKNELVPMINNQDPSQLQPQEEAVNNMLSVLAGMSIQEAENLSNIATTHNEADIINEIVNHVSRVTGGGQENEAQKNGLFMEIAHKLKVAQEGLPKLPEMDAETMERINDGEDVELLEGTATEIPNKKSPLKRFFSWLGGLFRRKQSTLPQSHQEA
jgi:hypothetical protein